MKKHALFAAAAISLASSSPAAAQQTRIQLIVNFDGPQLGQILTDMGATWEKRSNAEGTPYYSIVFRNGANALAAPTVCNGAQPHTGCTGLRVWAEFTKPQQLSPGAVAQRVNQYNIGHMATLASYAENGDATLNSYIIADSGIALTNLRIKLQVFEASTATFSQALYQ